mmetsp:Transcript_115155/g.221924  ORF Transcript_115155/g.221924 Transcript_115155/m.221924 type:complete len:128 (+) Transcript_115155:55-438(+)
MGNIECIGTERRSKGGPAVGTYVWQEDAFKICDEPSGTSWHKCREMIEKELGDAEEYVREELCCPNSPRNAEVAAAKLCEDWIYQINWKIERVGYMLDACGWTQYERDGHGGHNMEPKLALLIKIAS